MIEQVMYFRFYHERRKVGLLIRLRLNRDEDIVPYSRDKFPKYVFIVKSEIFCASHFGSK